VQELARHETRATCAYVSILLLCGRVGAEGATLEMEPLVQYLDTTTMISLPVVEAMDDDTIVTYADSITTSASTELNGPTATEEEDENGEPDNTML